MKILVSACLLGANCKYNGNNNRNEKVRELLKGHTVIPICPEVAAGFPTPRTPMEIVNGIVTDQNGVCLDGQIRTAVEELIANLKGQKIDCAILQSRSPTCGVNQIYDGSFSGTLVQGSGVLASALKREGYVVLDCEDVQNGLPKIKK